MLWWECRARWAGAAQTWGVGAYTRGLGLLGRSILGCRWGRGSWSSVIMLLKSFSHPWAGVESRGLFCVHFRVNVYLRQRVVVPTNSAEF